jgi:hypothetical protein
MALRVPSFLRLAGLGLLVSLGTFTALPGCAADADGEEPFDDADGELVGGSESHLTVKGFDEPKVDASERATILASYKHVDPSHVVPADLLEDGLVFVHANKAHLQKPDTLTVIDFSRHSKEKRFFVVDLKSGAVAAHVVAHGSGSDPGNTGRPTKFSNVSGSNASSLGFYVTAETYDSDKNGRSLRIDGVSSTNSNARNRGVVVHGASYVNEGASKQGRSWGCPALPRPDKDAIIDTIANGSVLYIGVSNGSAPKTSTDPSGAPGKSSVSAPAPTSGSGKACSSHGDCNPGAFGSGEMCVANRCTTGCLADWMCPNTCDVAARRCH